MSRTTDRRALLKAGGAGLALLGGGRLASAAEPTTRREPGGGFSNYGLPPERAGSPIRWISSDPGVPGDGVSWTPLHELEGTITPNGLHFERHHAGVPAIDGTRWRCIVDGLVTRELALDLEALHAMPMRSRIAFIECGGNSNALWRPEPVQAPVGWLHGLVSCSEWTGVPLAAVLAAAGPAQTGRWLVADGLDASGVTVSLPLERLPDDAMIALYQNGEAIRPEQGWPARLVLPGIEGIAQVKWLGRLRVTDRPAMSRFDTVSYTDRQPDGQARRFTRTMGVKSLITLPSVGRPVSTGTVEISGLAWSGAGRIERVEVSIDGGRRWREATLDGPVLDQALTRFRYPWSRAAMPAVLASRATDSSGALQPMRAALIGEQGHNAYYHYNAVLGLAIDSDGHVEHVHV